MIYNNSNRLEQIELPLVNTRKIVVLANGNIKCRLVLINQVTKQKFEFTGLFSIVSWDCCIFIVDSNSIKLFDGQYDYFIYNVDRLITNGIIQIGEYTSNTQTYNEELIITQYGG